MMEPGLFQLLVLPAGLGLFGFIEPCSIGSSLLFVKYLEDRGAAEKIRQTALFAATRALFIGLLGIAAVMIGAGFVAFQKGGPGLRALSGARGSVGLGVLFGLNVPACAAPLLAALLAAAAAGGASGATVTAGFTALAVFGFFLSAPLVAAVFSARARRLLDWLAHQAARFPRWAGALLIALGAWSVAFGLLAEMSGH